MGLLPFSPLTLHELNERTRAAARACATALTFHDRFPTVSTLDDDVPRALEWARMSQSYGTAASQRLNADVEWLKAQVRSQRGH